MEVYNDLNMLDVNEPPSVDHVLRISGETHQIPNGLVVPAVDSAPSGVDRVERSPQNRTPNHVDQSLASPFKQIKHLSRESSVLAHDVADQLSLRSSNRSRQHTEDISSDDFTTDSMPHTLLPPVATLPTGLCYDVRMRYHCELDPPKQRLDFHPEDPRRIYFIYKELCKAGLVNDPMSTLPLVSTPLHRVMARNATQSEICLVHDKSHFDFIESTKGISLYPAWVFSEAC